MALGVGMMFSGVGLLPGMALMAAAGAAGKGIDEFLVEDYMGDIDMLLTEGWLWTNLKKAVSKGVNYIKKLAKKLYTKIKDMISAFYNRVFKKLIDNLKAFAKKGLNFFVDALGIEINGDMDFNSLNVSV